MRSVVAAPVGRADARVDAIAVIRAVAPAVGRADARARRRPGGVWKRALVGENRLDDELVEVVDVLHMDGVVHFPLHRLRHVGAVDEPLQDGAIRNSIDARGDVELVVEVTGAGDDPCELVREMHLQVPHATKTLLVADDQHRLHALLHDELLPDAVEDLVDVLVRGGATVHDRRVVHELALSSGRVVVGMSQEHIVAVPLEEDVPERIKLGPARFRLVNGEDAVDGAERGLALVLPKTCDSEDHHPVRQVPVGTAQFEQVLRARLTRAARGFYQNADVVAENRSN